VDEELLNIKQIQNRLKISERTTFNLIKRGELKGFKAGREWRFSESDIKDYEKRQRHKAEEKFRRSGDEGGE
jgi:putative molybdopterin biosynthesis protein